VSGAVATVEPSAQAVGFVSEANAFLGMIERASRDPAIDVGKMRDLFAMRKEIIADAAKVAFAEAFADMAPQLPIIDENGGIKNSAGKVQSTYADWADVNEAIKPILHEFGFGLSFRMEQEGGNVTTIGVLKHRAGHFEETRFTAAPDQSGSKNGVQAIASTNTYGKRYTAGALLNLTSRYREEKDLDGNSPATFISDGELAVLEALITTAKADKARFLKAMKIDKLDALPADRFEDAKAKLNAKINSTKKAAA
jgi:hypothetical protein